MREWPGNEPGAVNRPDLHGLVGHVKEPGGIVEALTQHIGQVYPLAQARLCCSNKCPHTSEWLTKKNATSPLVISCGSVPCHLHSGTQADGTTFL